MNYWQLDESANGFIGTCVVGATGRIFGGHTLAHSLTAAALTVGDSRPPSSLHAVFLAPGDPDGTVEFHPRVLKRGRTLHTVRVEAHQPRRQILEAVISFCEERPSPEFQTTPPDAPGPHLLFRESPSSTRPARRPFEVKPVSTRADSEGFCVWIKLKDPFVGHPPFMHAAMLVYAIDFLISESARTHLDPEGPGTYVGASLDHAMWFHRPFRIDEWLLVHGQSSSHSSNRALCSAAVYSEDGALVSTAKQEALFRGPAL